MYIEDIFLKYGKKHTAFFINVSYGYGSLQALYLGSGSQ